TEHCALRDLAYASAFAVLRLRCCRLRKQRELRRRGGLRQNGLERGNKCDALVAGELGKVLLPPFDRGQSIGFGYSEQFPIRRAVLEGDEKPAMRLRHFSDYALDESCACRN